MVGHLDSNDLPEGFMTHLQTYPTHGSHSKSKPRTGQRGCIVLYLIGPRPGRVLLLPASPASPGEGVPIPPLPTELVIRTKMPILICMEGVE